jgi:CheY-like chemotaxis protein
MAKRYVEMRNALWNFSRATIFDIPRNTGCERHVNRSKSMIRGEHRGKPELNNKMTAESMAPPSPDAQCEIRTGIAAEAGKTGAAAPFALIIDDQEAICQIVATALAGLGVEFATYLTAKPAIASLDERRPDVIFLDVALDQSDAIDVLKGLSENRYTGIVQLMSGGRPSLLEAIERIGTRHGLALHPPLRKPFRSADIREVIVGLGLARSP